MHVFCNKYEKQIKSCPFFIKKLKIPRAPTGPLPTTTTTTTTTNTTTTNIADGCSCRAHACATLE